MLDTILGGIFGLLWIILTIVFFIWGCRHFHIISFSGAKGFFDGYFGMLIYSGIGAGIIAIIPFVILEAFFNFIAKHLFIFFLIDAILIGGTIYHVQKENKQISKLWIGFVAVFTIAVFASGLDMLISSKESEPVPVSSTKQTQNVADDRKSDENTNKVNTNETVEKSVPAQNFSRPISAYRADKDNFDNQIIHFSERINNHLQQSSNFRNTSYDAEGRQILQNIQKDKADLSNDANLAKLNSQEQQALLHLYDLEITRIQGMIDGIVASKNGGDFTPGLRSGTSAAYEFDDANAAYKQNYK